MQLSAPHGSIVILGGSRLFWIVCEAQWVTESTFTLTHACDIINLAVARVGTHTHMHTHTCTHTYTHARHWCRQKWRAKKTYAHRQVHTQHAQGPDKQSLPLGRALLLSSTEQNSQGSGLEEGTQCVSTLSPAKVSVSGDGSSQQLARLELSVCWLQAAGCLVLPGIYNSTWRKFPPLSHQWKHESHFFFFNFRHKNSRKNSANVVWKQTTSGHAGIHNGKNFKVNSVQFNGTGAISGFIVRLR